MASKLKPAYLIAGEDEGKVSAALQRLRARASSEGGSVEEIPVTGAGAADPEALVAAIPAMSLTAERRYLLADGVQRWSASGLRTVGAALSGLPDDVTVVLVARGKAKKELAGAVGDAGGEVLTYDAPKERELPARLVAWARDRGFALNPVAARLLVERIGPRTARLATELDRLATWVGAGGTVESDDLAGIADESERATWNLSDAVVEQRADRALAEAEDLSARGMAVPQLVHAIARRLRAALSAAEALERGSPPAEAAKALSMHPYAAKKLIEKVGSTTPEELRRALCAIADLELWTRGGSDYPESVALTLSVRRASGAV